MKDNLCTTPDDPWASSAGCGRRRTHHQRLELTHMKDNLLQHLMTPGPTVRGVAGRGPSTHMKDNLCTTPDDPWANSAGCGRRRQRLELTHMKDTASLA